MEVEEDIYDAIFSSKQVRIFGIPIRSKPNEGCQLVIITSASIMAFPIPDGDPGKPLEVIKTVPVPPIPGVDGKSTFRSAR